jgi:hypothetical protein
MQPFENLIQLTQIYARYLHDIYSSLNAYSFTANILSRYLQVSAYSNIVNNVVLYPILMNIIHHKIIVLVILSFI